MVGADVNGDGIMIGHAGRLSDVFRCGWASATAACGRRSRTLVDRHDLDAADVNGTPALTCW